MMLNVSSATDTAASDEVMSPDETVETEDSSLIKESILQSIKKLLGIPQEMKGFDVDVMVLINSAFNVLTQLGVGSEKGFAINSDKEVWSDFIGDDVRLNMVKTYIFLKVKTIFDPSQLSGAVMEAYKEQIKELEWRLNVQVDIEGAFDTESETGGEISK